MIRTRQDLHFYLEEDAKANYMKKVSYIRYLIKLIVGSESAHVYRYLKCLRHAEFYHNVPGLFHKVLYNYYIIKLHRLGFNYNIRIPINVCEQGVTIFHLAGGGGVLINAKHIGSYCKLQTGVLIGNSHESEDEKPIIGNNVSFGPGSKVLGKVEVGDNSFIGANAVVTKDVPSNALVAGIPAHFIKKIK